MNLLHASVIIIRQSLWNPAGKRPTFHALKGPIRCRGKVGRLQTGCDNFNLTWLEMRELGSMERLYKGKENPFRGDLFLEKNKCSSKVVAGQ